MFLLPKRSFKGGVHPLHLEKAGKSLTSNKAIRDFIPDTVAIPMAMHMGAPSIPLVNKGDRVKLGQVIGEPVGFFGLARAFKRFRRGCCRGTSNPAGFQRSNLRGDK